MSEEHENARQLTFAIRSENEHSIVPPVFVLPYVSGSEEEGEESFCNYDSDESPWKLSPGGSIPAVRSRTVSPAPGCARVASGQTTDVLDFFRRVRTVAEP
jgi:hypothetical protein